MNKGFVSRLLELSAMKIALIRLVLICVLVSGCVLKRQSEHYASTSKLVTPPVMEMDLHGLKSEPGQNEIFRFQCVSGILFPFMIGTTDLYLEVAPQNLTNERLRFRQLGLKPTSARKFTQASSVFLRLVK